MAVQYATFLAFGLTVFGLIGDQYVDSPATSGLTGTMKIFYASLYMPTILFLGALYAAVNMKFLMERIFANDPRHLKESTLKGWLTRIGLHGETYPLMRP